MKKIYFLLVCMFMLTQAKSQTTCLITYSLDSATSTYTFATNAGQANSIYSWDYGDGTIDSVAIGYHQFAIAGNYAVCYNEYDSTGTIVLYSCCVSVSAPINCSYTTYLTDPNNDGLVSFSCNSFSPTATVNWDFGDGVIGIGQNINHQYVILATYNACMTIIDGPDTCVSCTQIVVTSLPQVFCNFNYTNDSLLPNVVTFSHSTLDSLSTTFWTFGDNDSTWGNNVTHTYAMQGTYVVCVYENDSLGNPVCDVCQAVYAGSAPPCYFGASQQANLFTYDVVAYFDTINYLTSWDFGDGNLGSGNNIQHTYTNPGPYTICAYQIDSLTSTIVCQSCQTIYAGSSTVCAANFATSASGLDVYFVDNSNSNPATTTYLWDFGDGDSSYVRFPMHTYLIPGNYPACLTIYDSLCSDTYCQNIFVDSITPPPITCQALFVFTQIAPYQLNIVNLSSGLFLSYSWDFGDGGTSLLAYPSHTYSTSGSYPICLTVSDTTGCSNTYCDTLTVDSLGNIIYRSSIVGFTVQVVSPAQLTSVTDHSTLSQTKIYPNPVTDQFTIETPFTPVTQLRYSLRSMTGQLCKSGRIDSSHFEINVSALTSGIYSLELINEKGDFVVMKVVK